MMFAHYGLKEIKRRKLRSSANILGYVIAVSFLIVMFSLAQGYSYVAAGVLRGTGTHFVAYIPASTVCPCQLREVGPFFKEVYTPTFNSSLVGTISALPGVEDAAPYLMFKLDNLTISGIEVGDLATETNAVASDEVVSGRYLEKNDQNGVMLDRVFAELTKLNIGDQFTAFDRTFTVVGIVDPSLHSKPAGIANIYAPISVVQGVARSYGDINGFLVADINVVLVEISPQGDAQYIDNVKQSVLDTVETYAGMKGAIVGYQCGTTARKVVSITENGVWLTSIVLLIGATLFALKSQFGSVAERTKDIGILKAIGWTDSDIVKQVLFESFVQGLAGGFIGILLGCLIILLLPYLGLLSAQNIVLSVSSSMISIGLIASTAAGLFAGFLPAWHAARLQPAEALRHF